MRKAETNEEEKNKKGLVSLNNLSLNKSFSQNDNLKQFISNERKIPVKTQDSQNCKMALHSVEI